MVALGKEMKPFLYGLSVFLIFISGLNSFQYVQNVNSVESSSHSYERKLTIAKEIIKEADGKMYNLLGRGEGSQFKSFTMNYEYLTWWLGRPVSHKPERLKFFVREKKEGIELEKEITANL